MIPFVRLSPLFSRIVKFLKGLHAVALAHSFRIRWSMMMHVTSRSYCPHQLPVPIIGVLLYQLLLPFYLIFLPFTMSLNPTGIALIDRSFVRQLVPCALYDRSPRRLARPRAKEVKNVWCDDEFEHGRSFSYFLFPNGYDLVQRSVEAASKSRGAATPTHFFAFSLEKNKSSMDHYGVFYCTRKHTVCLLYSYSHVYVLMHVHSHGPQRVIRIGRPGAWCYLASCIRTAGVVVTFA